MIDTDDCNAFINGSYTDRTDSFLTSKQAGCRRSVGEAEFIQESLALFAISE